MVCMSQLPPAGYVRVSLFVEGAVSDQAQKAEIAEEARRRGLPEPIWYVDVDRTASDERKPRPDFNRMMEDIKANRIRQVIARSSDRFVRRPRELEDIIDVLNPRKIPVIFTRDSDYDLSTAGGRENARIKASVARGEVERMSERKKSAARQRARLGIPLKGTAPFGYVPAETPEGVATYSQQLEAAEAIKWAYTYLMGGGTLAGVAREWNKRGLRPARKSKQAREWSWPGVKQAILNPAVGGFRYYKPSSILTDDTDTRPSWECDMYNGNWSGILTAQEWRDLVTVLTSTRSKAGNRKKYLGSGIYQCGVCDDGTTLKSAPRHGEHGYRCRTERHVNVPGEPLDEFIMEMIRRALLDRKTFERSFGGPSAADLTAIQDQRDKRQQQLDSLTESWMAERISISVFERSSAKLEAEIAELDEKLTAADIEHQRLTRLMSFEEVDAALKDADLTQRRQLLSDVFPRILVVAPARGGTFDPERHVRLTDRAGREWPEWHRQWKAQGMLTSARALAARKIAVAAPTGVE